VIEQDQMEKDQKLDVEQEKPWEMIWEATSDLDKDKVEIGIIKVIVEPEPELDAVEITRRNYGKRI
jgi:hypothetical protein